MKQSKTTNRKNKSHGLFFTLLKNTPGYDPKFRDVIKEGIVSQYSKGKTESLSVMYEKYPREYSYMIEQMKGDSRQKEDRRQSELERYRVMCIAAAHENLKHRKLTPQNKGEYVKAMICQGCNCSNINKINLSALRACYTRLCEENKVYRNKGGIQQVVGKPSKN